MEIPLTSMKEGAEATVISLAGGLPFQMKLRTLGIREGKVLMVVAEIDACQIEHRVSSDSMQRVEKFVEFISSASCGQNWKENLRRYYEDGEILACNFFR